MSNETQDRAYSWDDTVSKDGEGFVLLKPGNYPFEVVKFERGRYEGGGKKITTPCNKAIVTCKVYDPLTGGSTTQTENFILHSSCEGILCAFFLSLGMRKHGEPINVGKFNEIMGKKGWCKIEIRKGTGKYEGKEYNEIKGFIDPANVPTTTVAPPPAQAQAPAWGWPAPPAAEPAKDEIPF